MYEPEKHIIEKLEQDRKLMESRPVTVNEAAEYLGLTPGQVRKYVNGGELKAYRIGKRHGKLKDVRPIRILAKDLDEFVTRNMAAE